MRLRVSKGAKRRAQKQAAFKAWQEAKSEAFRKGDESRELYLRTFRHSDYPSCFRG